MIMAVLIIFSSVILQTVINLIMSIAAIFNRGSANPRVPWAPAKGSAAGQWKK